MWWQRRQCLMSVVRVSERDSEIRSFDTVATAGTPATSATLRRLIEFRQNKIRTRRNCVDECRREGSFAKRLGGFDSRSQCFNKWKQYTGSNSDRNEHNKRAGNKGEHKGEHDYADQYPARILISQQITQPRRNAGRIDCRCNFVDQYLSRGFGRRRRSSQSAFIKESHNRRRFYRRFRGNFAHDDASRACDLSKRRIERGLR